MFETFFAVPIVLVTGKKCFKIAETQIYDKQAYDFLFDFQVYLQKYLNQLSFSQV